MGLIRTGLVLAAAIMLLPADAKKQTELQGAAATTVERTLTFCQRNPATCQAGGEMWALFVRKAEFGLELAAGVVRQQLARSAVADRGEPPAESAWRPGGNGRIEPTRADGSLRQSDRQPQWRGWDGVQASAR